MNGGMTGFLTDPTGLLQVSRKERLRAAAISLIPVPFLSAMAVPFGLDTFIAAATAMTLFCVLMAYNSPIELLEWWEQRPRGCRRCR